jgi:hypothetical protein
VQDVQGWLTEIGLGKLSEAIEHNAGMLHAETPLYQPAKIQNNLFVHFVAVSGSDLIELAQEDLLADLGATSIQVSAVIKCIPFLF